MSIIIRTATRRIARNPSFLGNVDKERFLFNYQHIAIFK